MQKIRGGVAALVLLLLGGLAALFPTGALAAGSSPVYVAAGGSDSSNDCASATNPCASLTQALAQVSSGGTIYVSGTIKVWNSSDNPGDGSGVTVSQDVTIAQDPGGASAVIEGTGSGSPVAGSLLTIGGTEQVTLSGLTFEDGNSNASYTGGAITNNAGGALTIANCTFADNSADASSHGDGGAIDNADNGGTGTVTITGSTFTGNASPSTGSGNAGAIDNADYGGTGTLSIDSSTFTDNSTGHGDGGAIDSGSDSGDGTLSVSDSTFTGNTGYEDGGAIDIADYSGNGTATVTGSTFDNNTTTTYDGGAIDFDDDAGGATLTVANSTFSGNTAASDGGGGAIDVADYGPGTATATATIRDSTFVNNASYDGGAIDVADADGNGTLTVDSSSFSGNTASADGGAIDAADTGTATVTVERSSLSGNTASANGGAIDNADYGGTGTLTVDRSTFSGNTATQDGGAIDNADPTYNGGTPGTGVANVEASTFAGNSATLSGNVIDNGVGSASNPTTATLNAAADVFDGTCAHATGTSGVTWNDDGYNAATDSSCLGSPAASTDAAVSAAIGQDLGSLAVTAGTTQTLQMLAANPARGLIPIGATATVGSASVALCPATDQRGIASESGKPCNPGAVQIGAPQITASLSSTGTESSAGVWDAPVTVTFTCTANGAALTCPPPQTLSTNGANQSLTQTVTAVDGGTASVTVSGVNIEIATPATTTPTPIATTVPSSPHVTVKSRRFNGKAVLVKLACASGANCAGKITLRYTHTVVKHHKKHRVTVTIAGKRYTLSAGHTATISVGLNATGRRLLKADHKLPAVRGTVTLSGGHAKTFSLTLKQPKKHKK